MCIIRPRARNQIDLATCDNLSRTVRSSPTAARSRGQPPKGRAAALPGPPPHPSPLRPADTRRRRRSPAARGARLHPSPPASPPPKRPGTRATAKRARRSPRSPPYLAGIHRRRLPEHDCRRTAARPHLTERARGGGSAPAHARDRCEPTPRTPPACPPAHLWAQPWEGRRRAQRGEGRGWAGLGCRWASYRGEKKKKKKKPPKNTAVTKHPPELTPLCDGNLRAGRPGGDGADRAGAAGTAQGPATPRMPRAKRWLMAQSMLCTDSSRLT